VTLPILASKAVVFNMSEPPPIGTVFFALWVDFVAGFGGDFSFQGGALRLKHTKILN